ncbi:hypothetical protein LCGC14_0385350 [marine sediment metagenome]|uniref:HNH nuclease domain-containing protein n=1 Tax=marine sediment metagenome TaxID=412755 RepID=A0A0F9WA86_9ZZZZ
MPKLGEIRKYLRVRSQKPSGGTSIWAACEDCGRERWAECKRGVPTHPRCRSCGARNSSRIGPANPNWKGGRFFDKQGYVRIKLQPNDFFYSMAGQDRHVLEHRLVMAKHLGRNLQRWELVHHKGTKYPLNSRENKGDNRIENLAIIVTGNNGNVHTANIKCPYCSKEFRVK